MEPLTEFERLKRQLEETRRLLEVAEQERERARQHAQRAEEDTRKTTLREYIEACHDFLYAKFTVETNSAITSTGSITSPSGRRCPPLLEPWTDFLEEQRVILGKLFSQFPTRDRFFQSLHYLRSRGEVIGRRRVGDEDALKSVLEDLVAEPVKAIMESIQDVDDLKAEFDIETNITFETRMNALSDAAPGPAYRPRTPPDGKRLRPDQICAYKRDDGDPTGRTMIYIIEHKAPHKLTLPHLRLGLRSMDIYKEVINRPTKPTGDETAVSQYNADLLVAAAVTQTFDYMVEAGLTYGCLTTGEAIVFLKIDWNHPITLHYHLAEPGPEVEEHRDNIVCCTAVSQVLAFTILALNPETLYAHGQDDRESAVDDLKTWAADYDSILRSIPSTERTVPPTSPAYKPTTYKGVDRSPYIFRKLKNRPAGRAGCNPDPADKSSSPEESEDDRGETRMPGTPTPAQPRETQRNPARRRGGGNAGSSSRRGRVTNRQYCTQKCLLGLVGGEALDEKCPNVSLHRGQDGGHSHPVEHATWLSLLREQLGRTLDDGIAPLGKQGARGVLFQVTLLAYGYTFVSKATTSRFIQELKHEANVYERLQPLQGVRVPVFLGAIDLREVGRTYYYDIDVRLVHLMFMSWGGSSLNEVQVAEGDRVKQEVLHSVRALHVLGVAHRDVRDANVLWNAETKRAMVIDFEQAVLAESPRPVLAPIVTNKRARRTDEVGANPTTGKPRSRNDVLQLMQQDDIFAARVIFISL